MLCVGVIWWEHLESITQVWDLGDTSDATYAVGVSVAMKTSPLMVEACYQGCSYRRPQFPYSLCSGEEGVMESLGFEEHELQLTCDQSSWICQASMKQVGGRV